jgi:hypothetical protein
MARLRDDGGSGAGVIDAAEYLSELDAELARAGIRGGRRQRIVAEFADHFGCDPDADLGDPGALAAQFADELGTSFARTAAFRAFLALAFAGVLVAVRFAALLPLGAVGFGARDTVALLISAAAGQVALAAGGLGLLRALQLRARRTIPRQEAAVLARRAGIGLAAGAVTIVAFPIAQSYRAGAVAIGGHPTSVWWPLASALGLVALLAAALAVLRAARLRPTASGEAGDLLVDLGPLGPAAARISGGSVNRLALALGAGLAIAISIAGVVANDPYDGVLRGLFEGGVFLGCYAALGRYLAIRR